MLNALRHRGEVNYSVAVILSRLSSAQRLTASRRGEQSRAQACAGCREVLNALRHRGEVNSPLMT